MGASDRHVGGVARAGRPSPGQPHYRLKMPEEARVGISLSGGGIRAAAFSLGALQSLRRSEVLDRVDTVSAVSGGNYIACAMAVSHRFSEPGAGDLWGHCSPEEQQLRSNLDYLAPGLLGKSWLVANVMYGFASNLFGLLVALGLPGFLAGYLVAIAGFEPVSIVEVIPATVSNGWLWQYVLLGIALFMITLACAGLGRRSSSRAIGSLAGLSGYLLLAVPVAAMFELGWRMASWTAVAMFGLLALTMSLTVDANRISLNGAYAAQLSRGFLSRRVDGAVTGIDPTKPLLPSEVLGAGSGDGAERFPSVVVCTTANLARFGTHPTAELFTVSALRCGSPWFGFHPTEELEARVRGGLMNVPGLMATSGAALSPSGGPSFRAAERTLLTIANLRTGMWFPAPRTPSRYEPSSTKRLRNIRSWLIRRWIQPGSLYVLREALGQFPRTGRFLYLTDGGHSENLGLIPLLEQKLSHVVVVDGTADPGGQDLARAISAARADLGVRVEIDPGPIRDGEAASVRGRILYPDGSVGEIFLLAVGLTPTSPWDLLELARRNPDFPGTSTVNQFFSRELFDAYRTLGEHAADSTNFHLPPIASSCDGRPRRQA